MSKEDKKRRDFLKKAAGLGVLGIAAIGGIYAAPKLKAEALKLRPPGAVEEDEYLALCIKCGQCLQVCPYDCILLEDVNGGAGIGTAYINPFDRGCYLCEAFPCILACPTGALDHTKNTMEQVHMGMAVVRNVEACIAVYNKKVDDNAIDRIYDHTKVLTESERKNRKVENFANDSEKVMLQKKVLTELEKFRGKDCTICADMCPFLPDKTLAIGMIDYKGGKIPEIRSSCVGCGVCVELCPTQVIEIIPYATYDEIYGGKRDEKSG